MKNEGFEAWKHWDPSNVDNHLWTWNSMLIGNTMRAAGFHIDEIVHHGLSNAAAPPSFSIHRHFEDSVVAAGFGRHHHIAQNLYVFAHRPTRWERRTAAKRPEGAALVPCRGCAPVLAARDRQPGKPILYEPRKAKFPPLARGSMPEWVNSSAR